MSKGKKSDKRKTTSKKKVNLPKKVKKGQITKKELKPVGMLTSEGKLKDTAPVEAISGIGTMKGRILRKDGIETVKDYKQSFTLFVKEKEAKKPKKKPKAKPKAKKTESGQFKSREAYEKAIAEEQKKIFPVLKEPSKKVKAPRKGNEYVFDELGSDFAQKPNFPADWKNKDGKIQKSRLRKHAIGVIEAEYGKESEEAQKMRIATKHMSSKEIYQVLLSWVANANELEFPHDE